MAQERHAPPPPPPPSLFASASPCQRQPENPQHGRVLPNSAVFRRRSSGGGLATGGSGGGGDDVTPASGPASASLNGSGAIGGGAWRGGEGEAVPADGLVASLTSPPLGPILPPPGPYVDPVLTAYLEVVDYLLRKPFSDEAFRLLLKATESDHQRVSTGNLLLLLLLLLLLSPH